ncbi:MAG: hypothetical protein RL757_3201, partial [Bacteroidota bacterium]
MCRVFFGKLFEDCVKNGNKSGNVGSFFLNGRTFPLFFSDFSEKDG